MSSRKGDISVQVVVLAIVALLVLVILIFIATGRLSGVNRGLGSCEAKNGQCLPGIGEGRCPGNTVRLDIADCPGDEVCCISAV